MNRELMMSWISQALEIAPGESIFLPGDNRENAKALSVKFRKALKSMAELDPVRANKLQVHTVIRDSIYWVELKRTHGNPLIGFKKGLDGAIVKMTIKDPERRRRLTCMKEDGLTLDEVEGIEGELSEDEKGIFNG